MTALLALLLAVATVCALPRTDGHLSRSRQSIRAYRKDHPCPSTGKRTGPCPRYVIDHRVPICAGGKDEPDNMTWQERGESKKKDLVEVELCRWIAIECAREKP